VGLSAARKENARLGRQRDAFTGGGPPGVPNITQEKHKRRPSRMKRRSYYKHIVKVNVCAKEKNDRGSERVAPDMDWQWVSEEPNSSTHRKKLDRRGEKNSYRQKRSTK